MAKFANVFFFFYLEVEKGAVSAVDDMGGGVRVGDVDEVHLPRRERRESTLKCAEKSQLNNA